MRSKKKIIMILMLLSTLISIAIIYEICLYGIEYVFTKTIFFYFFSLLSLLTISVFFSIIVFDKIYNDKISDINKFIHEFNRLYNKEYKQDKDHENIENLEKSIFLLKNNTIQTIDTLIESLSIISKSHKDLSTIVNNDLLLIVKNKHILQ